MVGRGWTTPEQYSFLNEFVAQYKQLRSSERRRLESEIQTKFFARWPEQIATWGERGRPDDAEGFEDLVSPFFIPTVGLTHVS